MMSESSPSEVSSHSQGQKLKKFKSAYILFSSDHRKQLQKNHPGAKNSEITKMLGHEWKTLDSSTKALYYAKEKEEKEKFNKMKQVNSGGYKYEKNQKNKVPLRFRTPYMFFIMHHKEQLNQLNKHENIRMIKELSAKWKTMTDEEKKPFIDLSEQDKVRQAEEWSDYMANYFKVKVKNLKKKEKVNRMIDKLFEGEKSHFDGVLKVIKNAGDEKDVKRKYVKKKKLPENEAEEHLFEIKKKKGETKRAHTEKEKTYKNIHFKKTNIQFQGSASINPNVKSEYDQGKLFELDEFIDSIEIGKLGKASKRRKSEEFEEFFENIEYSGGNSDESFQVFTNKKRHRANSGRSGISNSHKSKSKNK